MHYYELFKFMMFFKIRPLVHCKSYHALTHCNEINCGCYNYKLISQTFARQLIAKKLFAMYTITHITIQ